MRPSGRPASFMPTFFFESLCCWRGSAFMASGLKVRDADCQPQMKKGSQHSGCSRTVGCRSALLLGLLTDGRWPKLVVVLISESLKTVSSSMAAYILELRYKYNDCIARE